MHDFSCTDAADMHYQILADRVRYFKEDVRGVTTMCKVMEEMRNQTKKETLIAAAIDSAKRMLSPGKMSYAEIAECSTLTVAEVKALAEAQPV